MTGFAFEREVRESLHALGAHTLKVPHVRSAGAKLLQRRSGPSYDFLAVLGGVPVAIEAKSQARPGAIPFARVTPGQRDSLLALDEAGGYSWLLLNVRKPRNRCWAVRAPLFLALEEPDGRKSVSMDRLADWPFLEIARCHVEGALVWDLAPLFERATVLGGAR